MTNPDVTTTDAVKLLKELDAQLTSASEALDANRTLLLELHAVATVRNWLPNFIDLDQLKDPWLTVIAGPRTAAELRDAISRLGLEETCRQLYVTAVNQHPKLVKAEQEAEHRLAAHLAALEQDPGLNQLVDLIEPLGLSLADVQRLLEEHDERVRSAARSQHFSEALGS